jgi:hypothetical protein
MTNFFRTAFEVILKLVVIAGFGFTIAHESKKGELDSYLMVVVALSCSILGVVSLSSM